MDALEPGYPRRPGTFRLLGGRLFPHLALARISNSPTVVSNVLSGAAMGGSLGVDATVSLITLAMIAFYTAGMYLNDLCDFEIDCRERPERPLPSGALSRRSAVVAILFFFGAGTGLLASIGSAPFVSGLVLVSMIIAYDLHHKKNPFAPLVMAGCRLMVYITAYLAFAAEVTALLLLSGGLLTAYLWGLTHIARFEPKQRAQSLHVAAGLASESVRQNSLRGKIPGGLLQGLQNKRRLASFLPAAALLLPAAVFVIFAPTLSMGIPAFFFAVWVFHCIRLVYGSRGKDIGSAIGRLIAGISLLDSLVLTAAGAAPMVPAAFVAFGLTLLLQRHIRGT